MIYETLRSDIIAAAKARDAVRLSTLRLLDSDIQKEAADSNKDKDDALSLTVLRRSVKKLEQAIEEFKKGGRQDLVDKNQAEIVLVSKYLPQAFSPEELDALVTDAIAKTGAASKKEMGKVMGYLKGLNDPRLDFSKVSPILQKKLP